MGGLLALLTVLGLFGAIMAGLAWQGVRLRRRGSAGGAEAFMGPFPGHVAPVRAARPFETQIVEERMVPLPSADVQRHPSR